jgi:hypothetical protein
VDDLPLADAPSLQFLGYLARRLDGLPVALAVGLRPAPPGEDDPLVDAVLAAASAPVVPRPLGEKAVGRLAREALGADPDPAFARACLRATGGNALLVGELLGELRRRGAAPDARTAGQVQAVGTERMARDVRRRIDGLPPGAAALTRAVAVLGDGCAPGAAAALADLTEAEAVRAAAGLAAADVLADAGTELRFRHPVVRAAVADRIPAAERAAAHGRAARLLAARGAPAAVIAGHLRAAPPDADPRAVEHLRAAAAQARAQGLPEVAAAHLARALAEPPPAAERAGVLRELGTAELAAELPDGPDHLAQALDLLTDPTSAARWRSSSRAACSTACAAPRRRRWHARPSPTRAGRTARRPCCWRPSWPRACAWTSAWTATRSPACTSARPRSPGRRPPSASSWPSRG